MSTNLGGPASPAPGRVIVVTGPPGAGKTTTARLLADEMTPSVHLHCDDFWQYIRRGHIPPYRPESRRQNQIVIGVIAQAAFGYAQGGYHVLCEGILGLAADPSVSPRRPTGPNHPTSPPTTLELGPRWPGCGRRRPPQPLGAEGRPRTT